jgi:hypothetical protein
VAFPSSRDSCHVIGVGRNGYRGHTVPLRDERRPNGSKAITQSLKSFQRNFHYFSGSTLIGLDWNNVVAAGSSVAYSLLPLPENIKRSRRSITSFYLQLSPDSDVDLFLYGLTEEQAI